MSKRESKITTVILASILLLAAASIVGLSDGITGKIIQNIEERPSPLAQIENCVDSDNGINFEEFGVVTYNDKRFIR